MDGAIEDVLRKRVQAVTRKVPDWELCRFDQLPNTLFFILLIRGLFDAFYQKALMTEEAWKEGSRGRSYEDFLRHYDATGLLEHTETLKWHKFGCKQPISRTFKIRSLLCGSKINCELTDRATLLADKVAERINMKSGARTLAIIVMARFSSPELNRRILESLPQGKPKCSEEDFLDHVEHVSELMQKSFFASEFHRVAPMTAEDATSCHKLLFFDKTVARCSFASREIGKGGGGEKHARVFSWLHLGCFVPRTYNPLWLGLVTHLSARACVGPEQPACVHSGKSFTEIRDQRQWTWRRHTVRTSAWLRFGSIWHWWQSVVCNTSSQITSSFIRPSVLVRERLPGNALILFSAWENLI